MRGAPSLLWSIPFLSLTRAPETRARADEGADLDAPIKSASQGLKHIAGGLQDQSHSYRRQGKYKEDAVVETPLPPRLVGRKTINPTSSIRKHDRQM